MTFAALGVFVGYVVPGENVMQILGPGLALLSFLGGLFIPLSQSPPSGDIAYWTPMYGVSEVHPVAAPPTQLPWYSVVNAVAWLAIFVAGAAWRMSKDTALVAACAPGFRPGAGTGCDAGPPQLSAPARGRAWVGLWTPRIRFS